MCSFFKCVFACLLPPLAVLIDKGCSCDFLLNLFLTLLGYFPGCIHAYCVVCAEKPEYPPHLTIIQSPAQQTVVIDRQPNNGPGYNYQPMHQQMPHQMNPQYSHQMAAQSQQMAVSAPQPPPYYESASAPVYQPYLDKNMPTSMQ